MSRINRRPRRVAGQSLVEYALILVLVALAVVVAAATIGTAAQRIYGIVAGMMGVKKEIPGVISFTYEPQCGYAPGLGTGLYAEIATNIPASDLTVSTDTGFLTTLTAISGGWKIQPLFTPEGEDIDDTSLCPHAIVIQTSKAYGGTAVVYPVLIQDWP